MNDSPWGPPSGIEYPDTPGRRVGFGLGVIFLAWTGAYIAAMFLTVAAQGLLGVSDLAADDAPTWSFAIAALVLWVPNVAMLASVSRWRGSGNFRFDFSLNFNSRDLLGIPIGIASQLLLVGLVTWPFRAFFPEAFASDKLDKRATQLVDAAHGGWIILLALVVAFGAPVIEELVFRGFIQSGLQQRFGPIAALIASALWFTLVHVNPIEFPGLFAFAVVLGLCFIKTRRIGMSVVAHVAFNATALLLVSTR